jgi:predicted lipoprotein with Yx(FWY)xxD motif
MKPIYIVITILLALSLLLAACGPQANPGRTQAATARGTSAEDMTSGPTGTVERTATASGTGTEEGGIPNTGGTAVATGTGTQRATGTATMRATGTGTARATGTGTQRATGTAGGSRTPAASVTITISQDPSFGAFLVDGQGMTLYLFTDDTPGTSTCYDECATEWPPLVTTGTAQAGPGVNASKLGTTMRTDGTTQVTYNGWPLYYFDEDEQAGDVNGQGVDNFFLVSPAGNKIDRK